MTECGTVDDIELDSLVELLLQEFVPDPVDEKTATTIKVGELQKSKSCTKCGESKPLSAYGKRKTGLSAQCKPCVNIHQKIHLASSGYARESKRIANASWAKTNPDKIKEKQQNYQGVANSRARERRKVDPNYKLGCTLRNRVCKLLRGGWKSAPTLTLLGCSIEYFREWISSQFEEGMTWENHGSVWEIDHVKPCCSFDLTDLEQQRECFRWQNTRPMTRTANHAKNGYMPSDNILSQHYTLAEKWANTYVQHTN